MPQRLFTTRNYNGVDHVDDSQPDLSPRLQGLFDRDAQVSLGVLRLTSSQQYLSTGVRGIRELIEGARVRSKSKIERTHAMLAEKFFLYLEALIESGKAHADGSPRVVSESPHVPIRLPAAQCKVPPTFKAGAGLHAGRLAP